MKTRGKKQSKRLKQLTSEDSEQEEQTQEILLTKKQKKIVEKFELQKEQAKAIVDNQGQNQQLANAKPIQEKKQVFKGNSVVDEYFTDVDYHVLEYNEKIYDCSMNQTNIVGQNNNNKFYVIQILESDQKPENYYLYFRWGRVGKKGQISMIESCIESFEEKIFEKSVKGNYKVIYKDYSSVKNQALDIQSRQLDDYQKSSVDDKVKDLIKLIFDMDMMKKQMIEIGYDPEKMPLGKLANSTIQRGYEILKQLCIEIDKKKKQNIQILEQLSSEFYSYIPHDFGFSKAVTLKTEQDIKQKLEMLASLEQIQVATKILSELNEQNIFDSNYQKLNCNIKYIGRESDTFQLIEKYVNNSHGSTHNNYNLHILDIYRNQDELRYKSEIQNKMLLWHGSRLTNYVGILSQGLRIAPPEAPVTGYMFGKGIYFADMVSKSANYCGTSKENPIGCILLCEVALGQMQEKYQADYYANELPEGKHSTKGCGRVGPQNESFVEVEGVQIPLGTGMPTGVKKTSLQYNEYIVYDLAQVKLKYLIKLQYNYK